LSCSAPVLAGAAPAAEAATLTRATAGTWPELTIFELTIFESTIFQPGASRRTV
jgi:hypothetical protein